MRTLHRTREIKVTKNVRFGNKKQTFHIENVTDWLKMENSPFTNSLAPITHKENL